MSFDWCFYLCRIGHGCGSKSISATSHCFTLLYTERTEELMLKDNPPSQELSIDVLIHYIWQVSGFGHFTLLYTQRAEKVMSKDDSLSHELSIDVLLSTVPITVVFSVTLHYFTLNVSKS
jgi:hypothetical protein